MKCNICNNTYKEYMLVFIYKAQNALRQLSFVVSVIAVVVLLCCCLPEKAQTVKCSNGRSF